ILFNTDGSPWGCAAYSPSGHTCTSNPTFPTNADGTPAYQYFLNFDANDGRTTAIGCINVAPNGTCLYQAKVRSDGNDVMFGDLGNDWMVGGTGNDTLWGGWGNDLMNVDDDLAGCGT